ncbi:MAG: hypothetical protein IPO94_06650 [Saprospiraceae bacterium]|nr:hypothetical protein [Saprospiraceae bacterium]
MEEVVKNVKASGIVVVVSAGNSETDVEVYPVLLHFLNHHFQLAQLT